MATQNTSNAKKSVHCPVETTLAAIGGRWKVLIIHHLLAAPQRFGELARRLPEISARSLTRQLRELTRDGIVHRHDFGELPARVEYSLTPRGKRLEPVLLAMHAWGEEAEQQGSQ